MYTENKAEVRGFLEQELSSSSSSETEFRNNIITQHSFNKYFEKIGNHLWRTFVDPKSALFQKRETAFEELLDLIYEKIDKISNSSELFDFLVGTPLKINKDNISRSLMFHLLSQRSKVTRGFITDRFYLEFIRVFFICRVILTIKLQLKSIYSIIWPPLSPTKNYPDDVEIVRIQAAAESTLLDFLKKFPM